MQDSGVITSLSRCRQVHCPGSLPVLPFPSLLWLLTKLPLAWEPILNDDAVILLGLTHNTLKYVVFRLQSIHWFTFLFLVSLTWDIFNACRFFFQFVFIYPYRSYYSFNRWGQLSPIYSIPGTSQAPIQILPSPLSFNSPHCFTQRNHSIDYKTVFLEGLPQILNHELVSTLIIPSFCTSHLQPLLPQVLHCLQEPLLQSCISPITSCWSWRLLLKINWFNLYGVASSNTKSRWPSRGFNYCWNGFWCYDFP